MAEENDVLDMAFTELEEEEEQPSLTYKLDLDAGRIVGKVDGVDAVLQAVQKALRTPRFKCLLYDDQYGSEIEDAIISGDATREYIQSAIEGFVEDALLPDTRVLGVSNFDVVFSEDDTTTIKFKVDTIFGETDIEEVI